MTARTHYDVLGVRPSATPDEIRRAYLEKARQLHPDGVTASDDAHVRSGRAMQDVNEAWRVLREPGLRSEYDAALLRRTSPRRAPAPPVDDLDRVYVGRPVEPGDLTVSLVRAAPWIAVLIVLGVIVVFTAFARRGDDPSDLVGRCINANGGVPVEAPCDEPNDGYLELIVQQESSCPAATTGRVVASGKWYCLREPD